MLAFDSFWGDAHLPSPGFWWKQTLEVLSLDKPWLRHWKLSPASSQWSWCIMFSHVDTSLSWYISWSFLRWYIEQNGKWLMSQSKGWFLATLHVSKRESKKSWCFIQVCLRHSGDFNFAKHRALKPISPRSSRKLEGKILYSLNHFRYLTFLGASKPHSSE